MIKMREYKTSLKYCDNYKSITPNFCQMKECKNRVHYTALIINNITTRVERIYVCKKCTDILEKSELFDVVNKQEVLNFFDVEWMFQFICDRCMEDDCDEYCPEVKDFHLRVTGEEL